MSNKPIEPHVTPSELIRAKPFESSLSSRIFGRAESIAGNSWAGILVEEGSVRIRTEDHETELHGPAVYWLPWSDRNRMTIAPGAVGAYVNLGSTTLYNAIGYKAESTELRTMSVQEFSLNLTQMPDLLRVAKECFSAISTEHQAQASASRTIIEAYLRILLIRLWRAYDVSGSAGRPRAPTQEIYNRFNNLVELHFRDRWSVSRYAQSLNISRDRLGDICRKEGGHAPKHIIDSRISIEACLILEHSTNSLEQVSGLLGFATAAHFSRFFSRMIGIPPGSFRSNKITQISDTTLPDESAAYEWP